MTRYKYFLILGLALSMFGCGGSDDTPLVPETPDKPEKPDTPSATQTVTFTTDVLTRSVVTSLGESAEMNVYAKEYQTLGAEDFVQGMIKSVNKNGVWQTTPEIKLKKDQKVFLYAVYPYEGTHTDPSAIPVDATKQVDYLFSGEGVLASYASPTAKLTMSHALSVLAFNICKSAYAGAGMLQEITIQGEKFATSGVLNVEKGTIGAQKDGVLNVKCNMQLKENGWTENLPQTFTLPVDSDGKNIAATFVIDGKAYDMALPSVKIEQGYKYIFRLGLTDSGLTVFTNATEKISLKQEADKMPVEGGVNKLTFNFSGKSLSMPSISGKSLTPGIVNWGDKSSVEIYHEGMSHRYMDGKPHVISVENWNVEEVTFSSMKGIDAVDLSKF